MSKNQIKYIGILIVGLVFFIIAEMNIQDPIDWRMTFNKKDKIPYGTYVLYDILPDLFKNEKIITNKKSFYQFYSNIDKQKKFNYFIVNANLELDDVTRDLFVDFVFKGNNLFIASSNLSENLLDTLNISINSGYDIKNIDTTSTIYLVNPKLKKEVGYLFVNKLFRYNFRADKKENFIILGLGEDSLVNFAKIKMGEGYFFINLQPLAFSNFHILNSDKDYVINSFSYLPNRTFVWDEYYNAYAQNNQSPMRYILSRTALKFAFYLFLLVLFIYLFFKFKREQRIIPVIEAPKNDSANFVKTIGQLHFLKKDYTNISKQKINLFLEKIRQKYYLKTNVLDEKFIETLSVKSNKPIDEVKQLINFIEQISLKQNISEKELIDLNKLISQFDYKITF